MTSVAQIVVLYVLVFLTAYFIGFYRGSQAANKKAVADLGRIFRGTKMWDKGESHANESGRDMDDLSRVGVDAAE